MQTQMAPERLQAEKDELNWLLTSGVLGRSSNLARMLTFVCEKHFQGQDDQITEYSIATEALGRRDHFDPQDDTIVHIPFGSASRKSTKRMGSIDRSIFRFRWAITCLHSSI